MGKKGVNGPSNLVMKEESLISKEFFRGVLLVTKVNQHLKISRSLLQTPNSLICYELKLIVMNLSCSTINTLTSIRQQFCDRKYFY